MEGINLACLGLELCPVSLVAGVGIFLLVRYAIRKIADKYWPGKAARLATIVAAGVSAVTAFVLFHFLFAPAFPGYYMAQYRPRNEDLVGTWVATHSSQEYIALQGYTFAESTLVLTSSGEFTTTDFPDMLLWHQNHIFYSGAGRWSVIRDFEGTWQVQLIFESIDPVWYPDPPLSRPTPCAGSSVPCKGLEIELNLWNRRAPYYISGLEGDLGPQFSYQRVGDIYTSP